ncbi:MAG: hypothetical protein AB8H86_10425 [Polyangiales bacterium]
MKRHASVNDAATDAGPAADGSYLDAAGDAGSDVLDVGPDPRDVGAIDSALAPNFPSGGDIDPGCRDGRTESVDCTSLGFTGCSEGGRDGAYCSPSPWIDGR